MDALSNFHLKAVVVPGVLPAFVGTELGAAVLTAKTLENVVSILKQAEPL